MAGEWGKTPEWMILLLSYFMTALTLKLKVIKASEQPVLGFQNTTKSCLSKADEVVMSFFFPPNSLNFSILLHKLLAELQWGWERFYV